MMSTNDSIAGASANGQVVKLYNTKAHVFQLNPLEYNNAKPSETLWQRRGNHIIPITIVTTNDPTNGEQQLKLLGTNDDDTTFLIAPLKPGQEFQPRTEKFGQWIDDETGIVYGLGFTSQNELLDFMETFKKLQIEVFGLSSSSPNSTLSEQQQLQKNSLNDPLNHQNSSSSILNNNNSSTHRSNTSSHHDQLDKGPASTTRVSQQHQLVNQSLSNNINNTSETSGLNDQRAMRLNSTSSTASNNHSNSTSKQPSQQQQFSSNTLAHPGHRIKYQQTQQHQQTQQQYQQQFSQNQFQHLGHQTNNLNSSTPMTTNSTNGNLSMNNGVSTDNRTNNSSSYLRSQSMFGLQRKSTSNINNNTTSPVTNNNFKQDAMSLRSGGGAGTPDTESSTGLLQHDWQVKEQLRYENERLKRALEESSKNAGIWQEELHNLRTNNMKLTEALENSRANVEDWIVELNGLRSENQELRMRLSAADSSNNNLENESEYLKDLQKYKNYAEELQSELTRKEEELEELQKSMEILDLKSKKQNGHSDDSSNNSIQRQKLEVMNAKFEAKISELENVQKEFAQYLEKINK